MGAVGVHDPVEALNAQARALGWPSRVDASLAFESRGLAQLVDAWRDCLGDRKIPPRSAMSARALKSNLNRVALFERVPGGEQGRRYRVRLIGTKLSLVWGDMTGKFLDEALPPKLVPRWHAFADVVLALQQPMRFLARADYQDKDHLAVEAAAVPLANDDGDPTMVMAAMYLSSEKPWDRIIAKFDGTVPPELRRAS